MSGVTVVNEAGDEAEAAVTDLWSIVSTNKFSSIDCAPDRELRLESGLAKVQQLMTREGQTWQPRSRNVVNDFDAARPTCTKGQILEGPKSTSSVLRFNLQKLWW